MSPLPRHSRSGRSSHCSDANNVPVRPKPVAISSQIEQHVVRGTRRRGGRDHRGRRAASRPRPAPTVRRSPRPTPTRAPRPFVRQRRSSRGRRTRARSTGKRNASKMSAPKPSSPTESAPIVSPWYAPPNARKVAAAGDTEVVPVLDRDLERLLDGRRAVAGVEEVRVVDGNDAGQRFRELDNDPVAVSEHRRMGTERELAGDGVVELGDVVAEGGHPQRRDRVEVVLAVDVDELVTLGPVDDDRVVVGERRHLREAVPHDLRVALHPVVVCRHGVDSDAQCPP